MVRVLSSDYHNHFPNPNLNQPWQKPQTCLIREAGYGDEHFRKNECSLTTGGFFGIKNKTWDWRKCSMSTVERCSPKTNRVIYPIVKYMGGNGTGRKGRQKITIL